MPSFRVENTLHGRSVIWSKMIFQLLHRMALRDVNIGICHLIFLKPETKVQVDHVILMGIVPVGHSHIG